MASRITVTIARQLGSGGSYVGQQIANKLGIKYIDREVLHLAAEQLGLDAAELAHMEEKCSTFWHKLIGIFGMGAPDTYSPPPLRPITDKQLFDKETEIMKVLAAECSCVIIGRGAVDVLPYHDGMVNLFLHAPVRYRVKRIMELYDIKTEEAAKTVVEESDRERLKYFTQMTGRDWLCAKNYDLSIDTSALPLNETIEVLVDFIRRRAS